jgi:uncharacterized RDD family membrane protein YckC
VQLTERLKIDTPEQIALEFPVAGIGSRFLALTIDTLLQFVLYVVVFVAFFVAGRQIQWLPSFAGPYVAALVLLFLFCVYWGYFAFFEAIWKGQTPGKRLAHIRVIKESGRPINAYEAIGRNLMRTIDVLPAMYAVGITCMMLNRYSRRLGDYVAGTVVVHDSRTEDAPPDWKSGERDTISNPDVARLSSEELVLIETYLQRRFDLEPQVRISLGYQIAQRITGRTGLKRESTQHVDDFLEAVARHVRDTARYR